MSQSFPGRPDRLSNHRTINYTLVGGWNAGKATGIVVSETLTRNLCQENRIAMKKTERHHADGTMFRGGIGRFVAAVAVAVLLAGICVGAAWGQAGSEVVPGAGAAEKGQLTIAAVEAQIKQTEAATDVEADLKTALLELYKNTLTQLKRSESLAAEVAGRPAQDEALSETVKGLKATLATATSQPATQEADPATSQPAIDTLSDEQIAQLLEARQGELTKAQTAHSADKKAVTDLKEKLTAQADRKTGLSALIAAEKDKLTKLDEAVAAFKPGQTEPAQQAVARKSLLLAQIRAAKGQIEALQAEQTSLPLRGELLTTQHALALRAMAASEKPIAPLREFTEALAKIRDQRELKRKEQEVLAAAGEHAVIRKLAEEDLRLTRQQGGHGEDPGMRQNKQQAEAELRKMKVRVEKLTAVYTSIIDKVQAVGMTNAVGLLMRQHRAALPDVEAAREAIESRQETITRIELQRLEFKDRIEALADVETRVAELLADLSSAPEDKRKRIDALARKYLGSVQKTLAGDGKNQGLLALCDEYAAVLNELDLAQAALIAQSEQLADYIDERILWIRSTDPIGADDFPRAAAAAAWLADPAGWGAACGTLWGDVVDGPIRTALAILVLGALLLGRRPLAARLRNHPPLYARAFTTSLSSITLAVLGGLIWPLAAWYVSSRLGQVHAREPFVRGLEQGLAMGAVFILPLCTFRSLLVRGGPAEVSLGWSTDTTALVRRMMTLTIAVGLPAVVVVEILHTQPITSHDVSLGRMLHILLLIVATAALGWWLRPKGRLVASTLGRHPSSLGYRTRMVWYSLVVGLPVLLAAFAFRGYYYTSLRLTHQFVMQVWLVMGLVLVQASLMRWILLHRRRIAAQMIRARKLESSPAIEASAGGEPANKPGQEKPEELDEEDYREILNTISVQPKRFVRYLVGACFILGVWAIWADVLPALGFLQRFELWTSTYGSDDPTKALPVTLADLLLSILTVLLTFAASRNLPGMLEILILQRLRVTAGARYAISTISKYIIVVVGIMLACHTIGVSWSHVQWLVAALSLGLGFGLQEIFANFVSGLIILFERPIRVGDIVTVGDVTGKVSRIQGRATTIVDWDRKEFIVPNKKFITEELINWSLSDDTLRAIIPVGIAYGSDTRRAHSLLLKIAADNPRILADPPPSAMFLRFGASSLDFELRAFVKGLDDFIAAKHELHMAIDDAFRKANITIAFPQQDIHIQSLPEGFLSNQRPVEQDRNDK